MNDKSKYDMLETKQTNATSGNENLSLKKKNPQLNCGSQLVRFPRQNKR